MLTAEKKLLEQMLQKNDEALCQVCDGEGTVRIEIDYDNNQVVTCKNATEQD